MTQARLKGSASEGLMDAFERCSIIHVDPTVAQQNHVLPLAGGRLDLVDVHTTPFILNAKSILFDLLAERGPEINISHSEMPSWKSHIAFIESKPYHCWYLVRVEDCIVGTVYLTKYDEVGICIFKNCQRRGFGSDAVRLLIEKHPRKKYLANINQANEKSIAMFDKMGFKHVQDTTYEFNAGD